jgi:hypothetical protein
MSSDDEARDRSERLVAEDVKEATWLRLRRLTSSVLCHKNLIRRARELALDLPDKPGEALLEKKAAQTAWAVRSAIGFWEASHVGLNAKVLSRYYALLQISIAEQVASPNSRSDLEQVQRHTEAGHGLFTLSQPETAFPASYYIGALRRGHFYQYAKHLGIDLDEYSFGGRPQTWPGDKTEQLGRLVSLVELFARIPELESTIDEYLNVFPLTFHVGHASRNMTEQFKAAHDHMRTTGNITFTAPQGPGDKITYISIYPTSSKVDIAYLNSLGLPFTDIQAEVHSVSKITFFNGKLAHPPDKHWHEYIDLYKSGYSGTSYIVPLWQRVNDPFVIHFMILYALSIVVRYLPSLWHDIEDGDLDNIRALIEHYLVIVDNVLPRLAVERITGRRLLVVQPGSLFAPT